MNLLIVAATRFEIEPFNRLPKRAELLITGVGVPATLYHLTRQLLTRRYDLVIQAGLAGSFCDPPGLSAVMAVREDTFADLGIAEGNTFKTLFEAGFAEADGFPYSNAWLVNKNVLLDHIALPVVRGVTVNKPGADHLQNQLVFGRFNPAVESMEGAAFHYVCLQQQTKFLQIRSVSNAVGERDKSKWMLQPAIENLNKELNRIVNNLVQL